MGIKSGAGSQNAIYIRNETDIAEESQNSSSGKGTSSYSRYDTAVTYDLLREELGRCCGISKEEAGLAIGNQLDCAPHEDGSGYIFMVP